MPDKENKEHIIYSRLDSKGLAILENFMSLTGSGKSAAVRMIIREWAQMKEERARLLSTRLDPSDPYWLTEAGIEQSR